MNWIKSLLGPNKANPPRQRKPMELLEAGPKARARDFASLQQQLQLILTLQYRAMLESKQEMPSLEEVQFRVFSQTTEDGLLHYIFSLIGTTNKRCVEICAGNGVECNCANLIINHGWQGLLFDGKLQNVRLGNRFYKELRTIHRPRPIIRHSWITRDNINELVSKEGFAGDLDLLSLDIDGNDYWIWEALDCIQPRVVILEYCNAWGPHRSITQRYQEDYVWRPSAQRIPCCGASLAAFVKLGRTKGYRLVACQNECFNAVFIRNDVGEELFPEISTELCFHTPGSQRNFQRVASLEQEEPLGDDWVEV